jgi:hypothetical protein
MLCTATTLLLYEIGRHEHGIAFDVMTFIHCFVKIYPEFQTLLIKKTHTQIREQMDGHMHNDTKNFSEKIIKQAKN